MDAGIEVKVESVDEVEPYDGSYACLICTESVRGQPALVCSKCNSNPFHRTCDPENKYAEVCPTCGQKTVEAWKGGRAGTAAASEMIDLTGEGEGRATTSPLPPADLDRHAPVDEINNALLPRLHLDLSS